MVLTVLAFGRPLRAGCGVRGQFWDRKRFLAIFAGFLGMELVLKLSLKYVVRLLVIDVDHFGAELAATDVAATVGLVQVDLVGGKPLLAILATYLFLFHSSDLILQPQLNQFPAPQAIILNMGMGYGLFAGQINRKRGLYNYCMDSYRHSQEIRERAQRHNRLMKMIHNYSRTTEENRKLEKIKSNTMMEINLRYLRSEHNRHYRFPFLEHDEDDEEPPQFDPFLAKKELIIYDLQSQNSVHPSCSPSKRTISLESSRRVVSLEVERENWQRDRLWRLDMKAKHNLSSKNLTKKNSFSEKMKSGGSRLRLPQLKIQKYRENIKTESRALEEEPEIHSVISKKLITETSQGRKKMHGVERYLQKAQPKGVRLRGQRLKFN